MDRVYFRGSDIILIKKENYINLSEIFDTFLFVEFFEENFSKERILCRLHPARCFVQGFSYDKILDSYYLDYIEDANAGVFFCDSDWLIDSYHYYDEDEFDVRNFFETECEKCLYYLSLYKKNLFHAYYAISYDLVGHQKDYLDDIIGNENDVMEKVMDFFGVPDTDIICRETFETYDLTPLFALQKNEKDFLIDVCKAETDGEFITVKYCGEENIFYIDELKTDFKVAMNDAKFRNFYEFSLSTYLDEQLYKLGDIWMPEALPEPIKPHSKKVIKQIF